MKKLKIILRSNKIFLILFIIISLYVVLFTKIIKYNSKFNNNDNEVIGKIVFYKIDGNKLTIELDSIEKIIIYYYFNTETEKNDFVIRFGINDQIKVYGKLNKVSNNTIFSLFNYKKYLYNKHIYYTFSASKIILVKDNKCIKDVFISRLNKYNNKEYMYTFILGDKAYLDISDYQNNGVSHLLAISGMHVNLLLYVLEDKLKIKNRIVLNTFLFLYSYIVSFAIGVLRILIFRIIKSFDLNLSNIKVLFLTACILLFINPFYIYDYGFIYSFLIAMAIIIANIKGNFLIKLIKLSFISFIISIPVTLSINYSINIMTILNNLINVPYITFIVFPFSIIIFLIPKLEFIFELLIMILEFVNKNCLSFNIIMPKFNIVFIILYYLVILCYFKFKKILILLFLIIILIFNKYSFLFNNNYLVYYLDVSQGDCILIVSPQNNNITMIDTGGTVVYKKESWEKKIKEYNLSDNIILFLNSISINKINNLIISHGDYDHMGEAINLVENFKVENVIFNCGPYNNLEKELIEVLENKNINYYSCIKELNIDKYKLQFLNTGIYDNENDNSSVIYLNYNNYKFLFMGDASTTREQDILEKYNLSNIYFLKVGHHGSNTSSSEEFINSINPKYSLISVGKNNRYGHPKESVLDILENSKIYRTDLDGSIEIKLNKSGHKIRTCPP